MKRRDMYYALIDNNPGTQEETQLSEELYTLNKILLILTLLTLITLLFLLYTL